MYFCASNVIRIDGTAIRVPRTVNFPHSIDSEVIGEAAIIGSVLDLGVKVRIKANMNSFQLKMKLNRVTEAKAGATVGNTILISVPNVLHPSITAASSISSGT
jgi:hypothetical protein